MGRLFFNFFCYFFIFKIANCNYFNIVNQACNTTSNTTQSSFMSTASSSSSASANILGSAKKPVVLLNKFGQNSTNIAAPKPAMNNQEFISSFKKSLLINQQHQQDYEQQKQALAKIQQPVNPLLDIMKEKNMNLETTYILNSPTKSKNESVLKQSFSNYECTPLQPPKLKNADNYDVSDLRSEDDTDDEEEPSKPIPQWAKEPFLSQKAQLQSTQMINFTKLFKASSSQAIVLDSIFKLKRKKFYERSSSANWSSPPVWNGNGLNGEESFYRLRKNF